MTVAWTARGRLERKLVWLVGSPRSGSTWLYQLLCGAPTIVGIHEPLIGAHLGLFVSAVANVPAASTNAQPRLLDLREDGEYFFAESCTNDWAPGLGRLILSRYASHVPRSARRCVVHEPNGSEGADAILAALPASRMLFLVRDGRDVVDSLVDASRPGSWLDATFGLGHERTDEGRLAQVIEQAHRWKFRTEVVRRAYDRHPDRLRCRVKYEDLLRSTGPELSKIFDWLEVDEPANMSEQIAAKAFSSVPASQRGPGQFVRAASPGLWRRNLSEAEQEACEAIMGPTLADLGYERSEANVTET